jgi:ribosomal protein S18 acetylase RimI-like enzyme
VHIYEDFYDEYIEPFHTPTYVYDYTGWIVWRVGTGLNVELLHIRTHKKRRGYGRRLFYKMLDRLTAKPPYHSVFGFTRVSNAEAKAFYGALGFNLVEINGLYQHGHAVLFWQEFNKLCEQRDAYFTST